MKRISSILINIGILLVGLWILFPIFFMVISSLKDNVAIFQYPPQIFFVPTLDSYFTAILGGYYIGGGTITPSWGGYFFNSAVAALSAAGLALTLGTLAAYGLANFPLKRKDFTAFSILSLRMAPVIVMVIPLYVMMRFIGLTNNLLSLIIIYTIFDLPFIIWITRGFLEQIPLVVTEAAKLDGASDLRILVQILLPLIKPGLAVAAVFSIVQAWNDFPIAYILGGTNVQTVPMALAALIGVKNVYFNVMFAVGVLNMLPALALAFAVHRYWARGLTLGLVKG